MAYQLVPQFQQAINIVDNAISDKNAFKVSCSETILHSLKPIEGVIFQESPPGKCDLFEQIRQQKVDSLIDTIITKENSFVIESAYEESSVVTFRQNHPRIHNSLSKEEYYQERHCIFSGIWNDTSGFN